MKYMITQEQWNFLNRNAMAVGAKPIEPLNDEQLTTMYRMTKATQTSTPSMNVLMFARAIEAHILGEQK